MTPSALAVLRAWLVFVCLAAASPSWADVAPTDPEPEAPTAVTAEMQAWLSQEVSLVGSATDRMMRLLRALERRDLIYDASVTGTAAEVFHSGRYNCLGLAHLVVGLARALDVDAYYVDVAVPRAFHQRGDLTLSAAHVAAAWGPPAKIGIVELGAGSARPQRAVHRLDDHEAHAMHLANRGAEHLLRDDPQGALRFLDAALALDPRSAAAWVNQGVAHRRMGHHARAAEAYRRALAIDPGHRSALKNLAALEQRAGNHEAAHEMLAQLVATGHRSPTALVELGDLRLQRGDVRGAGRYYRRAVRHGRQSPAALAARGRWALARGRVPAAGRWLARARAHAPRDPAVLRLERALGHSRWGR